MSYPLSSAVADLLGRPSIFRTPGWLPESTWHMHIPFAFLLMDLLRPGQLVELGTQKGASYCAFCEGVAAFGTGTRLSAVDHWEGDHQTGAYARDTYDVLREHHDPLYGAFSTLLRESFDDARPRFDDGSIDLLHIDGLHTYEAVRHDFETWLPKVSRSGVILMHDTEVRTGDFGVWRFWEEVQARYPTLNFPFGCGLGVVAVGEAVPAPLLALCRLPDAEKAALYALFEALGDRVRLLHEYQEASRHAAIYLEQGLQMQKVYETYKAGAEEQIDTAMRQYQAMFEQATALQNQVAALIAERDALLAGRPDTSSLHKG
ncbi:class I SAM-dependent methyltransferase [Azospirillum argentinense]|uniref:Class I SAM-dependent methyltransferase n=1 Tax=Azospirillum argentinense TaxID=2970906 RepID=A0A5B0KQP7_9PROT|nr:class I SAM-dependent methyltransferase [Azospirillum argentinense]KAA1054023.1 Glycosyltransferase [Azospirillum argentinense]